jgi:hypothetical protein
MTPNKSLLYIYYHTTKQRIEVGTELMRISRIQWGGSLLVVD